MRYHFNLVSNIASMSLANRMLKYKNLREAVCLEDVPEECGVKICTLVFLMKRMYLFKLSLFFPAIFYFQFPNFTNLDLFFEIFFTISFGFIILVFEKYIAMLKGALPSRKLRAEIRYGFMR